MSELKQKEVRIATVCPTDLEGNLTEVVEYLNGMINDHEKSDTEIYWIPDDKTFEISYMRRETLHEAERRILREQEFSERVKDRELEKLRELQEKYGR